MVCGCGARYDLRRRMCRSDDPDEDNREGI